MNKQVRHAIFVFFIIAFITSVPLVIGYSMGYRYNFKKQEIQFVGALFIDTNISSAQVKLNGEPIEKSLPLKMVDLLPNSYDINITAAGYHSWQKTLPVHERQTTFAQEVYLLKDEQPSLYTNENIEVFEPSPERTKLLYSRQTENWHEWWLHDMTRNEQDRLIYRTAAHDKTKSVPEISWSAQDRYILLNDQTTPFILDTESQTPPLFINTFDKTAYTDLYWDNRNAQHMYGRTETGMNVISLENLKSTEISTFADDTAPQVTTIKNGFLYSITETNTGYQLMRSEIQNPKKSTYLLDLPSAAFQFVHFDERFLGLIHNKKEQSYILNIQGDVPTYTELPSKHVQLDAAKNKFIYHNDFEVWTLQVENETWKKEFITRYSDTITEALLLPQAEYLAFSNHQHVYAAELDGRDRRNTHLLSDSITIEAMTLSADGYYIYLLGTDNITNKRGIYSIHIAENQNFINELLTDLLPN